MNIGDKIKKLRNDKKLTQKQLAIAAGISEISIRKYENGERFPKYETIQSIADALETSAEHLMSINNSFSIELLAAIQKAYGNNFCDGFIGNIDFIETLSSKLNIDDELLYEVYDDKSKDLPIPIQKELLKFLKKIDLDLYDKFIKDFNFDMPHEIRLFVESIMIHDYKNLEGSNFMAFKNYLFITFGDKISEFITEDNIKELQEETEKFLEFALFKIEKEYYGENEED
ncbi:helix-turn-helix domain-containing protein [Clostridium lundense]|uniref:helix-turn-helix domain-containing protein n=1 Tax=Clostridium lundense TaxID=319475 RepID=UPI0005597455|nr:helix-turn-helix transcriptional regulator [Clostridium lundense]